MMYTWQIFPVTTNDTTGYAWQWKREDLTGRLNRTSAKRSSYYYDCVMDAKKHGFDPAAPRRLRRW